MKLGIQDDLDAETSCRKLFTDLSLQRADVINVRKRLPRQSTNPNTAQPPKPIVTKFVRQDRQLIVLWMQVSEKVKVKDEKNTRLTKYTKTE